MSILYIISTIFILLFIYFLSLYGEGPSYLQIEPE